MITITRNGLQLSINDEIIPAQGSSDVPVEFINDEETYQGYFIEPRVGWYKNGFPKSTIARYEEGIIYLPAEAFLQNDTIVIVIALVDLNNAQHIEVTHPVKAHVVNAPLGDVILPDKETWERAVEVLVRKLNEQIQADVAEAVKIANKASSDASDALNKANDTSDAINKHIENGDFIPKLSIGTIETGLPGTDAEVSIDGTKEEPVINMTLPAGHDGEGQTTIRKDGELVRDLGLKTERTENPTSKSFVQLTDVNGNTVYIECSPDNMYHIGTNGSEISTKTLLDIVGELINIFPFYSAQPKAILDKLKNFITTIE